ncbi:hypothetical protein F4678DRAFT_403824 [Xylaria arbuscula]|nr:hypothetical protein F4678DRAFT_403824 [Xylaria arbuscula]
MALSPRRTLSSIILAAVRSSPTHGCVLYLLLLYRFASASDSSQTPVRSLFPVRVTTRSMVGILCRRTWSGHYKFHRPSPWPRSGGNDGAWPMPIQPVWCSTLHYTTPP